MRFSFSLLKKKKVEGVLQKNNSENVFCATKICKILLQCTLQYVPEHADYPILVCISSQTSFLFPILPLFGYS